MDLIDRQAAIDMIRLYREDEAVDLDELESSIAMMPSVQPVSSFITWLLDEIWDEDMWALNCGAFPEIVCRKLTKLGYVRERNGEYERLNQQTGDNR